MNDQESGAVALRRAFNLPMLLLYGIGTTVGAGIYALLGEISAEAGALAPWSFLLASLLAATTAFSFAELARRYPQSAATAMYVQQGLQSRRLGLTVGYLVAAAGVVSSAALLNGMANYLQVLIEIPRVAVILGTVLLLAMLTAWGIAQSSLVAALVCVIEVSGLVWISTLSVAAVDVEQIDWSALVPTLEALPAVTTAAILAFYAYIGFEDMVEVAEEVKDVQRTLPRAIVLTLFLTTGLYLVLVTSTQLAVSVEALATAKAPMADAYQLLTGRDPWVITLIGMIAIVNGVLIQMIMASRILYGLASRGQAPRWLSSVNAATRTPIAATLLVAVLIATLGLLGHLSLLAQMTSTIMLIVFAMANLSLWLIKRRYRDSQTPGLGLPSVWPLLGFVICSAVALRSLYDFLHQGA